jgi:hypothetical protein
MNKPKVSVCKSKNVKRASKPLRKSKYDWYIEQLQKLKRGEAMVLDIPAGMTARQYQTRLAGIEDRRKKQGILKAPKGYRPSHYETEDGKVAVEWAKI